MTMPIGRNLENGISRKDLSGGRQPRPIRLKGHGMRTEEGKPFGTDIVPSPATYRMGMTGKQPATITTDTRKTWR